MDLISWIWLAAGAVAAIVIVKAVLWLKPWINEYDEIDD